MERLKLVTLEQIYERFDVAHIRRLINYSDKRNPINMDNVSMHAPLSESVPSDMNPSLYDGEEIDYKKKVALLEAQLEAERNRLITNNTTNENYVVAQTDDNNETVEVPASLLAQIVNVLKNNNTK